jgi:hypothetical protein
MARTRNPLLAAGILLVLLLVPEAAHAACAQWNIPSVMNVRQGKYLVVFRLVQKGSGLRGSADVLIGKRTDHPLHGTRWEQQKTTGSADGSIIGSKFAVNVYWSGRSIGVYEGSVGPQGRVEGTTFDRMNPKSLANWFSTGLIECGRR